MEGGGDGQCQGDHSSDGHDHGDNDDGQCQGKQSFDDHHDDHGDDFVKWQGQGDQRPDHDYCDDNAIHDDEDLMMIMVMMMPR